MLGLFFGLTGYVPIWLLTDSTTVGPVVLKPDSQAYTETGISTGLPIATELRPPLACDLKTIAVVGSRRLTSPEWVTSGGASVEADSLGRVMRPGGVVSAIFSDIVYSN